MLYLTAVSEYDQVLAEDQKSNRLEESLGLFENLLKYPFFRKTHFLLFLNKVDLLRDKIKTSPVSKYFPDFEGPDDDYDTVINFFTKKFLDRNQSKGRSIGVHQTCAVDTENIRIVDSEIQKVILNRILDDLGFGGMH